MNENATVVRIRPVRLEQVSQWLRPELKRHARNELVSGLVKLCLAAVAALITALMILFVVGREALVASHSFVLAGLVPVALLSVAFIAQTIVHRRDHGVMQVHGQRVAYVDHRTHFGDPNDGAGVGSLLRFPAWLLFSAFESVANAWRLANAEPEFCARVLAYAATENRRVFIPDLEHMFSPRLVPNLKAMLTLPGVMISSRETPALILSDELGTQIRDML